MNSKENIQTFDKELDFEVALCEVLKQHGFTRHIIPNSCPNCYTAEMFCHDHPQGVYVLGFGNHVVTVVDGNRR